MKEERKIDRATVLTADYTEEDIIIDRQLAISCHILGLITSIFGPLIFVLTKRNDAEFLAHHEREALNFQLTVLLTMITAVCMDMYVFKEVRTVIVIIIVNFFSVFSAVVKAHQEVYFRYPLSIRFVPDKKQKAAVATNDHSDSEEDK